MILVIQNKNTVFTVYTQQYFYDCEWFEYGNRSNSYHFDIIENLEVGAREAGVEEPVFRLSNGLMRSHVIFQIEFEKILEPKVLSVAEL